MKKIEFYEPFFLYFSDCFIYTEYGGLLTGLHMQISGLGLWNKKAYSILC